MNWREIISVYFSGEDCFINPRGKLVTLTRQLVARTSLFIVYSCFAVAAQHSHALPFYISPILSFR